MRSGPLRKIAPAYVPFRLYRVRYELGRTLHTRLFALDAVDGSLDLFEFPRVPDDRELLSLDSRNRLTPALSEGRAVELLRERSCASFFSKAFSSFASLASTSPVSTVKSICRIGLVFMGWRSSAMPRAGCRQAPHRRRKGVRVFRTVAGRLTPRHRAAS